LAKVLISLGTTALMGQNQLYLTKRQNRDKFVDKDEYQKF